MYGWSKDGFHMHGVGISRTILRSCDQVQVTVDGRKYMVSSEKAIEFVNRYKSIKIAGRGTKIGIISKSIMEPMEAPQPIPSQVEEDLPANASLF